MIKSMTGYGKSQIENENISIDLEIKTVNSRYLDIQIRMPSQFNFMEDKIRREIESRIKRGRVGVFIKLNRNNMFTSKVEINKEIALDMKKKLEELKVFLKIDDQVSLDHILKNEDVISFESAEFDKEYIEDILITLIRDTILELDKMRVQEGSNLEKDLLDNLAKLEKTVKKIELKSEVIVEEYKRKLENNIRQLLDVNIEIDQDRLANEVAYYADKVDINEEFIRLYSHINQFKTNLKSQKQVGKKLDFISQEMLREMNTIGSKSSNAEIIAHIIDGKTYIEKLKEQVQNIE